MKEWRPIAGLENAFEVSEDGEVRRVGKGPTRKRLVKPELLKSGYLRCKLYAGNKCYKRLVHRLVAEAFCYPYGNPANHTISHINGITTDNSESNLAYHNSVYMRHLSFGQDAVDDSSIPRPPLEEWEVGDIRSIAASGAVPQADIAKEFNVSGAAISKIIHRKSWKAL